MKSISFGSAQTNTGLHVCTKFYAKPNMDLTSSAWLHVHLDYTKAKNNKINRRTTRAFYHKHSTKIKSKKNIHLFYWLLLKTLHAYSIHEYIHTPLYELLYNPVKD